MLNEKKCEKLNEVKEDRKKERKKIDKSTNYE